MQHILKNEISHQNDDCYYMYRFNFIRVSKRIVITCFLRQRITSFKIKYSRWLKQIIYLFGCIQTPGPLMSMLADKVKLTQYNKHVNKQCAITSLVCCYIGAERNDSSQRTANLCRSYFLFVVHKLIVHVFWLLTSWYYKDICVYFLLINFVS